MQAKEVADLELAGSAAHNGGRYTRAVELFTEAIQKTAANPHPNLYLKRENFASAEYFEMLFCFRVSVPVSDVLFRIFECAISCRLLS
jgi:hypothetical protein